ncbi:MAG: ferritin-like domain-containing protein [Rhodothermales bacterium]
MKLNTLHDLYLHQLKDLYSAESQLVDALPDMAKEANHPDLKQAFSEHLQQTKQQKSRLEKIGKNLGEDLDGETCQAMKGLIKEGKEMIKQKAADPVKDAGLIAAAQRVEHYEIAGYGTVCTFAEMLGRHDDLQLLKETLSEEKNTDDKLNKIAKQAVDPAALQPA